jgi:threonylcarbamoyladenosine tRNA methylthiotransferase MtaB
MSKFFVWTFGCRCNQADSAAIREGLCRHSLSGRHSLSESESCRDADVIVINTCTVTHRADQQVRQTIRRLHRENPSAQIIVTGCYAERDPDKLASLPGVGLVVGNADRGRLPELIEKFGAPSLGNIIHAPIDDGADFLFPSMSHTGGKTRPLVKLQDGCDARCSYCIVPKVRGPGRSARPEDILAEVQSLVAHGFQEIVLTGIHLGAFGRGLKGRVRLIDLLRDIVEIPGLGRIRLSSIEPMLFDRALVRLAAESTVIARHFHIPLQSGSARVLRRMRRPYTPARFRELLHYIHGELPDAGLGSDVLVGFPGETDDDFAETCALLEEAPLTYLHVFPFSPREGTEAFSLPDRVPSPVVKLRLAKALEISRLKNLLFRRKFLGRVLPAITLANEENLGTSIVLTGNYIHARVPGLAVAPNRLIEIRIDDVRPDATYASVVSQHLSQMRQPETCG